MAEPVALQIKPGQSMTLGDMLNMANAATQLQQAQQMNPMLLKQKQMELDRASQINPLDIRRATAETNVSEQTADPRISQAKTQSETALIQKLQAQYGLDAAQQDDFTKILSGFAYDPRLSPDALKRNGSNAIDVLHEVKEQAVARGIDPKKVDMITAPAMAAAMRNPEAFPAYMQNMIAIGMSASEKRAAGLEKVETTGAGQVVRITPQTYGQPPKVSYETPGGVTPAPSVVEINGVKYFVNPPKQAGGSPTLTPAGFESKPAAQPTAQPSAQPGRSPLSQYNPNKPLVEPSSKLVYEDMPVPAGGLRQMNEQQNKRYYQGQAMFSQASDLNEKAADQQNILNNIKKNLAQAQSSKPGQLLRQAGKFIAGSEELDTLLKNLAENQLAQAKLMGADTVHAQNIVETANGSADIDPKALAKIVERADATRLAVQMYNEGLSKYKTRDPLNSAIHADRFQQAWKDNYDPRIFMVENINNSNLKPEEKQKDIKRILGIATDSELAKLREKATNLRKLQRGDF